MKNQVNLKNIKPDDLNLNDLTPIPINWEQSKKLSEECDKEMDEYEKKYGKNWWDYYARDQGFIVNYDRDMKMINSCILHGTWIRVSGHTSRVWELPERQKKRMTDLFGKDCDFFKLYKDKNNNIGEILIKDAIKSGKWEELPDELQPLYHERVSE